MIRYKLKVKADGNLRFAVGERSRYGEWLTALEVAEELEAISALLLTGDEEDRLSAQNHLLNIVQGLRT